MSWARKLGSERSPAARSGDGGGAAEDEGGDGGGDGDGALHSGDEAGAAVAAGTPSSSTWARPRELFELRELLELRGPSSCTWLIATTRPSEN